MSLRPHLALALACVALAACDDTRSADLDDGVPVDGSRPDAAAMVTDAAAGERDAGPVEEPDAGPVEEPDASVELTFDGCAPDFSGDVVVVRNASSIAVSSTSGGALTGSVQLALQGERGLLSLSTQHRVDTGAVVNVIVGTTWTNLARDSGAVLSGEAADPIGGDLNVRTYDEASGRIDVEFIGVTLQNPSTGTVCRIDGRLQTYRLSF